MDYSAALGALSDVKTASGAGAPATEKGRDEPKPGWEEIKDTNVSRDQKQESIRKVGREGGGSKRLGMFNRALHFNHKSQKGGKTMRSDMCTEFRVTLTQVFCICFFYLSPLFFQFHFTFQHKARLTKATETEELLT